MYQEDRDRLARIDERTALLVNTFAKHVDQDREDFKYVHTRINKISAKQNWVLGVGAAVAAGVSAAGAWLKSTLT